MKTKLICAFAFIIATYTTIANGGPVDESYAMQTGHISLKEMTNIRILSEKINIKLEENYSVVDVVYTFKNEGEDDWIDFGFPVDFSAEYYDYDTKSKEDSAKAYIKLMWQDDYILNFRIFNGEKLLKITNKIDDSCYIKNDSILVDENEYEDIKTVCARRWYLAFMTFPSGSEKTIRVSFKVKNYYSDAEYSKSFFYEYSSRRFSYDFSPAKFWGDGKAGDFSLTVDATLVEQSGGKIAFSGLTGIKNKNGIYSLKQKNIDFAKTQNFKISYEINNLLTSNYVLENRIPLSMIKSFSSSAQSNEISAVNALFDSDMNTSAELTQGGKNDALQLELNFEPKEIAFGYIGIINGNVKSKEDYYNYARIKKLRYEFEYDGGYSGSPVEIKEVEMENLKYEKYKKNAFYDFTSQIAHHGDDVLKPKKLKIIILETYPGRKSKNIRLSELFFLGLINDSSE